MGQSIQYFKGGRKKTYGTISEDPAMYAQWQLSDTNRLVGLHGRVKDGVIVQLGIITYNTELEECPIVTSPNDVETDDTTSSEDQKN